MPKIEQINCFECGTLIDKHTICTTCNPEPNPLGPLYSGGFSAGYQAGLRRGAEIANSKADHYHTCSDIAPRRFQAKKDWEILCEAAQEIEQAILKEMKNDSAE